jgi:iron(III) transport system permease protein
MKRPALLFAALVVLACSLLPVLALARQGFGRAAFDLLWAERLWKLFAITLATSVAVAALAAAIGTSVGIALSRTDVIGRGWLLLLHAFPMFVPPFLLALGWFHVAGSHASALFSRAGLVLVLGVAFAPIVTTMTVLGLDGIDPALDDAARMVAHPRRVMLRILLPIARPSIVLGGLIAFALAFVELGVPMFLRVDAYPAAVFARLGGVDYAPGEAFVLVLPQLAVAILLLVLERRLAARSIDLLGVRRDRALYQLGRWRLPVTIACGAVVACGLVPFFALARDADWGGIWRWAGDSVANSVIDASIAATIITGCAIVLGHAIARGIHMSRVVDAVTVFAFIIPAAVLAAGSIEIWSGPSTRVVYGSSAIIIIGYVGRYAVLGVRPLALAFTRGNARLEDAAATAGAGYARRMLRIVIPLHRRAIAMTWVVCAVFCLRDLETAVVYYPPGRETLPIRIFTLEANGPQGTVASLALLHVAITAVLLVIGVVVWRRKWRP